MTETAVTILVNGESCPFRPFSEEELQPLREKQEWAQRFYLERKAEGRDPGFTPNWRDPQLHLFLLEAPRPGDDVTFHDLPPEFEELRVWWSWGGSRFSMPLYPPREALLREYVKSRG